MNETKFYWNRKVQEQELSSQMREYVKCEVIKL
jgi:hypothetical protein